MTNLGQLRQRDARLKVIDLPGMQVKHDRLPLIAIDAIDAPLRPAIGKQAEVPATRNRQVESRHAYRRSRQLPERSMAAPDSIGVARRRRDAVPVVMDRKNAR